MKEVVNVYKPAGWNLTGTIEAWRNKNPEYKDASITFAGRLDPLAEGVLLLLSGEAIKEKEEYLSLDKTYEATFLFGFRSDTYDILGMAERGHDTEPDYEDMDAAIRNMEGRLNLKIPAYSSVPVDGVPLFELARKGTLNESDIPSREMEIASAEPTGFSDFSGKRLLEEIKNKINQVQGDFRQNEITEKWQRIIEPTRHYALASATITCSSGTYIRSLAEHLGKVLGSGAVLFSLVRTRVGEFNIQNSIRLQ